MTGSQNNSLPQKIWRDQILMDTERGTLVLCTTYGYHISGEKHREILDYLWENFGYIRKPGDPVIGAIRGHREWVTL